LKNTIHDLERVLDMKIVDINSKNISQYPAVCFLNPKNEGYLKKLEWLKGRFYEGLKIKQLYLENERKCNGFIEYISGENAWRAVKAEGYLFIHCIWITPNKYKEQGYGSQLVEECIRDVFEQGKCGVAVITSEGPFMAGKNLFLKNGFHSVAHAEPSFELMVKKTKECPDPEFNDWKKELSKYDGLNIIYSLQCPWVARSISEFKEIAAEKGLKLKLIEIKSAREAQSAPSIYAAFNLIYNGKLLSDHYISSRRFLSIIKKELPKKD